MNRPENYNTKQRKAIMNYVAALNGEHITAGQIMKHFDEKNFLIGLSTIYRHLDRLVESGKMRKYTLDGVSGACYQYIIDEDIREYFHLKCEECGALLHLKCSMLDEIQQHVYEEHTFHINAMKTVFYGKCAECFNGD
ncbi:MAG: transcriptional repressor [Eubacteriales bacterium]|jgi:Fur family ferric uptake transcriptional regulator|nr:transcriptional repressor [Eubacteriales bacterium]